MQVQIKFIVGGANSAIGGFSAGDVLRCSDKMAHHLVNEVKCAEYLQVKQVDVEATEPPEPAKRGRKPNKPA